jgi:hypothetical protein
VYRRWWVGAWVGILPVGGARSQVTEKILRLGLLN